MRKSGGNAKVDANVLGVSGMGLASGTHEGCRVELVLAGNADPSRSETLSLSTDENQPARRQGKENKMKKRLA